MEVHISAHLRDRLAALLCAAYPNEGGGFLLGTLDGSRITVRDVRPVNNVARAEEQYHRFAMTPADWAALEDEADARGLSLVGYYHSHPDSPGVPSEYDRVHALPNFRYLIASISGGALTDLRAWQLDADRSRFEELALHVEDDASV